LIRTVDGIVWECDANDFRFTFVSEAAERILGYPISAWLEDPHFWANHVHPDDREEARAYCLRCTRQRRDHTFEYRMKSACGKDVWIKAVVTVVSKDGAAVLLRGIMLDVTKRKAVETELFEKAERLRLAIEVSDVGSWDWDLQQNEVVFSPEWKKHLGYSPSELPDRYEEWERRIHPDDRTWVFEHVRRSQSDPASAYVVEFRLRHKDGSWRWIHSRGQVVRDSGGQPKRMLGCHVDLTPQKQGEAERAALLAQLLSAEDEERRRIARELHDTTAQQLAAVKFNLLRLKGAYSVFRCDEDPLMKETYGLVEKSLTEVRNLTYLLHPPLLDEFGLSGALKELAASISRQGELTIEVEIGAIGERLPRQIEMALFRVAQESLNNLQRHSGSHSGLIRLDGDADQIRLEIQDSGKGIDWVRSNRGEGLGIRGMRERIRLLDGTLEIESDEQGTTVLAVIPLRAKPSQACLDKDLDLELG